MKDLKAEMLQFHELLMKEMVTIEKALGRGPDGQLPEGYRDPAALVELAVRIALQRWSAGFRATS